MCGPDAVLMETDMHQAWNIIPGNGKNMKEGIIST